MTDIIKAGTVFAGVKSGSVHNEIINVYIVNGKKMVDVEQYGATLANKGHEATVTFYYSEITRMFRKGLAHVVLIR